MKNIYILILVSILQIACQNIYASENEKKDIYGGIFGGSFQMFNLELPTLENDDSAFSVGIEGGIVFNTQILCGLLYSYGDFLYTSDEKDDDGDEYCTLIGLHELLITFTYFPFSKTIDKPSGFFIRGGIGGSKFFYSSTYPEYKHKYDDVTPNYGISGLAGTGYSFDICNFSNIKAGIDFSHQKYVNPGNLDDTDVIRVYVACEMFY